MIRINTQSESHEHKALLSYLIAIRVKVRVSCVQISPVSQWSASNVSRIYKGRCLSEASGAAVSPSPQRALQDASGVADLLLERDKGLSAGLFRSRLIVRRESLRGLKQTHQHCLCRREDHALSYLTSLPPTLACLPLSRPIVLLVICAPPDEGHIVCDRHPPDQSRRETQVHIQIDPTRAPASAL